MIGVYDFCGHEDWTFAWLESQGGRALLERYWEEAVSLDAQQHAAREIIANGIEGMKLHWQRLSGEEEAGYEITVGDEDFDGDDTFRIDMSHCPLKGFLMRNGLERCQDYCDHCMGWIGPLMRRAGFCVDHEHNHRGQCWWEMRREEDPTPPSQPGELAGQEDVRLKATWNPPGTVLDRYRRAHAAGEKLADGESGAD